MGLFSTSGIEEDWVKQDTTKPHSNLLRISDGEMEACKQVVDSLYKSGEKTPSFRVSKKQLKAIDPLHKDIFNHGLLVLRDDDGDGYKIGMVARSKAYFSSGGEEKIEEGVLGYGAFGVVKVVQWQNGEIDAVKIEDAGDIEDDQDEVSEDIIMNDLGLLKAMFIERRETVKDWIGDGGKIKHKRYVVQKLHKGIELNDYFQGLRGDKLLDRKYSDDKDIDKLMVALQAARAIKELHEKGILHCDIKPENFMINWEGRSAVVAAIDFGFSMKLKEGEKTVRARPQGTEACMAPEIAEGYAEVKRIMRVGLREKQSKDEIINKVPLVEYSVATDIYSLGKMFESFMRLSGLLPQDGQRIVKGMMDRDPGKRSSIDEVIGVISDAISQKQKENIKQKEVRSKASESILDGIKEYSDKKTANKGLNWIKKFKMRVKDQLDMVESIKEIISEYYEIDYIDQKDLENFADQILIQMKNNQNRHDSTIFARASKFNLEILQKLPDELRKVVSSKLGISKSMDVGSYQDRKKLANHIRKYQLKDNKKGYTASSGLWSV